MEPENKSRLQRLLKHHVVSGHVTLGEVGATSLMYMLDRTTMQVGQTADRIHVGTTITTSDLEAENGVVHVIDQVLIPE